MLRKIILSICSGILLSLPFWSGKLWIFAWLAFLPLFAALEGRPLREYSLWAAILGEMAEKIVTARAAYMYAAYTVMHPEVYGNMWDPDGPRGLCSGVRDTAGQNNIKG